MTTPSASVVPNADQAARTQPNPSKPAIRWRFNLSFLSVLVIWHGLVFFALPLWQPARWLQLGALGLLAIVTTPMWALIHEGIHGHLHPRRELNRHLGRLLSVCFGSPFRLLRHGHLHHHRHSRLEGDRTEVYNGRSTSRIAAACAFYPRLLGGLYLAEFLANPALLLLPRRVLLNLLRRVHPGESHQARQRAEQELLAPANLRELRIDSALTIALYAAAFYCYGAHWPDLVALLMVRALLISLVDNSFHYDTPISDHLYALNLRLPRWASPLVLNFNMHRTHHRHVALPWHALPAATRYEAEDPSFASGVLRQLKGPVSMQRALGHSLPEHWQRDTQNARASS